MEYEILENDEERRQAMQKFYKKYDTVRRKYGLTMSAHASFLMIAGFVSGREKVWKRNW